MEGHLGRSDRGHAVDARLSRVSCLCRFAERQLENRPRLSRFLSRPRLRRLGLRGLGLQVIRLSLPEGDQPESRRSVLALQSPLDLLGPDHLGTAANLEWNPGHGWTCTHLPQ